MTRNCRWHKKNTMENHLSQMQTLMEEETSFVCVTLVDIKGSTPRAQGGRMLVTASGLHSGTVGGGLVEAKALKFSQEFLQQNEFSGQSKFIHEQIVDKNDAS